MRYALLCALVAMVSGCPDQDAIGTTAWVVASSPAHVRANASGRIVEASTDLITVRDDTGAGRWSQSKSYNDALALDAAGNVYVVRAEGAAGRFLYKLAAADGATVWRVDVGATTGAATVVAGVDGVVWYLVGDNAQTRWTRYGTDGRVLSSGRLPFQVWQAEALADGGLLAGGSGGALRGLDAMGAVVWQGDAPVERFALHDDGEISAIVGGDLVRYGADHVIRWRRAVERTQQLRALGRRLLVGSYNDIGSELELFDAGGASTARERFTMQVALVGAGTADLYLLTFAATESVDLHDRVVPYDGWGEELAARRLPEPP